MEAAVLSPSDAWLAAAQRMLPKMATTFSILLALSPLSSALAFRRTGSTGSHPFVALFAMMLNYIFTFMFGSVIADPYVRFVGCVGLCLCSFYIACFYSVSPPATKSRIRNLLLSAYIAISFYLTVIITAYPDKARTCVGLAGNFASVFMFGAPLTQAASIVRKQSLEGVSKLPVMVGFCCSMSWALYGFQLGNVFMITPNVIGSVLGGMQLLLFAIFTFRPLRRLAVWVLPPPPQQQADKDTV